MEVEWKLCEHKVGTLVSIKPGKGELYQETAENVQHS